jgi:ABC-2 type transport system ATP-binding protein
VDRARIEIKELLKELKAMGKTIIVSSHILPELADFCNKIGIIEKGEMIVSGDVNDIIRQVSGAHTLEIRILDEAALAPLELDIAGLAAATPHEGGVAVKTTPAMEQAMVVLRGLENVAEVKVGDNLLQVSYTGEPNREWEVLRALVMADIRVLSFATQATDLEDIFMRVTKGIVS